MNIVDAMQTPDLFGDTFTADSWETWRAVLSAAFALPMDADRLGHFKKVSGGRDAPTQRVRELWCIIGRRAAKTHTAGSIAVYLGTIGAAIEGLTDKLSPGERGVIALLATDRSQAKVALRYIHGILDASPILSRMVEKKTPDTIELNNGVSIEVSTSNYKAIRGRTLLAVILDECAFFTDSETSTLNDQEIYRAAVPGLATTGGLLIGISSPYARRGLLYSKYRKHFGQNHDVLVVKGKTRDFNPTLPQKIVDDALDDDPEAAKSEWLGEFRDGISTFLSREVVESSARTAPLELPFDRKHRYFAFTDPAGGGKDEYCMAIGHREGDNLVVDVVRAQRGVPAAITAEYAELLRTYHLSDVQGDKYAGSWPADEFSKHGIRYTTSEKPKSGLYQDALPAFNSGRVEIPPDDRLISQFSGLERRTARGGKDSIDHAPGGHDDRANVVAGLIASTKKPRKRAGTW